jgi:HlyD family secretion protein
MSKPPIFRKRALERLSSPEQLDQLVPVTSARGWLALSGIAVLLAGAVSWGLYGTVPSKVMASGILVGASGIVAIRTQGAGQVGGVAVKVGDEIGVGQLVARIEQPSALKQIANDQTELAQLQDRQRRLSEFHATDLAMKLRTIEAEYAADGNSIALLEQRLTLLDEKLRSQNQLVEKGIISNEAVIATTESVRLAREEIRQKVENREQLGIQRLELENAKRRELLDFQLQIDDLARRIAKSRADHDRASQVLSPYQGRVTEVHIEPGGVVAESATVAVVELGRPDRQGDGALEAVIFAPAAEGKKVHPGMEAQVSPSTVKLEEYGFIPGDVTFVSQFPVSADAIMRLVGNPELVESITRQGAPVQIHVSLERSSSTPSGFAWSSSIGPTTKVNQGTSCTVSFVTESRRPVDLVIPYLKETLGL